MLPDTHAASVVSDPIRPPRPDRHAALRHWRDGALTVAAFGLVLAFVFGSAGGKPSGSNDPLGASRLAEVSLPR